MQQPLTRDQMEREGGKHEEIASDYADAMIFLRKANYTRYYIPYLDGYVRIPIANIRDKIEALGSIDEFFIFRQGGGEWGEWHVYVRELDDSRTSQPQITKPSNEAHNPLARRLLRQNTTIQQRREYAKAAMAEMITYGVTTFNAEMERKDTKKCWAHPQQVAIDSWDQADAMMVEQKRREEG